MIRLHFGFWLSFIILITFLHSSDEKKAIPLLYQAMDEPFDKQFQRNFDAYFKLVDLCPGEGGRLIDKALSWENSDAKKFAYVLNEHIFPGNYWLKVQKCPHFLAFLKYFFSRGNEEALEDLMSSFNYRHQERKVRKTLPFFPAFWADYTGEKEKLIFNYEDKWREIFDYWNYSYGKKRIENKKKRESISGLTYDLRVLPFFYQYIALEKLKKKAGVLREGSMWNREPDLMALFPIDRDNEALAYLKDYTWNSRDKKWLDAACILDNFLDKKELRSFASELLRAGKKEKADYLAETAEYGCSVFKDRFLKSPPYILSMPPNCPVLFFLPEMKPGIEASYISDDLEESYLEWIDSELETLSKSGIPGNISRLKYLATTRPLLRQLLALNILSAHPGVEDDFFLKIVTDNENDDWVKVSALYALQCRKADIPLKQLKLLLENPNPFVIFYSLNWFQEIPPSGREKILNRLLFQGVAGREVYQKRVLKEIYRSYGYSRLKNAVITLKKDHLTRPALMFYLERAYENKDQAVLTEYVDVKEQDILVLITYALFTLDRDAVLPKIRDILEKDYQLVVNQNKEHQLYENTVERLLTLLVEAQDKIAIPLLEKWQDNGYHVHECKLAMVHLIPMMTPTQLNRLKSITHFDYIAEFMVDHYQPGYLPYIRKYISGKSHSINFLARMVKSRQEDLIPLWQKGVTAMLKNIPPAKKDLVLIRAFLLEEDGKKYRFIDKISESDEDFIVQQLCWCAHGNDQTLAFYALRFLLEFSNHKAEVDEIMKEKLSAAEDFFKIPSLIWFSRQKDESILETMESLLSQHPLYRYILIDCLKEFPTSRSVEIVVDMIQKRCFEVWEKIDEILQTIAQNQPQLLEPFIDSPDTEVKKKIFRALGNNPSLSRYAEIKKHLVNADFSLAAAAFAACRGNWTDSDLKPLISLYEKAASPNLKIDILEAIGSIDAFNAREFLTATATGDTLYKEFADLNANIFKKEAFISTLKQTNNVHLLMRGVQYLKNKDHEAYVDLLLNRFRNESDVIMKSKKKFNQIFKPKSVKDKEKEPSITLRVQPIIEKTSLFEELPVLPEVISRCYGENIYPLENRFVRIWRELSLQEKDFVYYISFSKDLKKWTEPVQFKEVMRMEDLGIIELPDQRILVHYLRCSDPNALTRTRPYFIILNETGVSEAGYFPLPDNFNFSQITVFSHQNRFYLAGTPSDSGCPVKSRATIFTSPDLKQWSQEFTNIDFPENVRSLQLRRIAPNDYFILSNSNLYYSSDLKSWSLVRCFEDYTLQEVVKTETEGYCAVLNSTKFVFYETYLSFSHDLRQWSEPLYTGVRANSSYGYYNNRLLVFTPRRVEAINLELLKKDTDGDGLTDVEEEILFTDTNSSDTDKDGILDKVDSNPLRKPVANPTVTMELRQLLLEDYMKKGSLFGAGGIIIVVNDGVETQSYRNFNGKILCFNKKEYELYEERFKSRGEYFRLFFGPAEFSDDQRSAVVQMSYVYSGLAGAGYEFKLKKIKNRWKVISYRMTWIS